MTVAAAGTAAALVLLHGLVTIGPTSPNCIGAAACTRPAAHVLLEFTRPNHFALATTDAHGRYQVRLTPGTWTVTGIAGVRTTPNKIVVHSVPSVTRNLKLDTGIR